MCLLLAFPFGLSFIVSTACTPLHCHNKQLLCGFNFGSSCSSRFELEKKSSLEVLGKLGGQRFPCGEPQVVRTDHLSPGFFPPLQAHRFPFSLSSGALRPVGAPVWSWSGRCVLSCGKKSRVLRREAWKVGGFVGRGCVEISLHLWGSVKGSPATDPLVSIQTDAALLWGALQTPLVLSLSRMSGAGWWCYCSSMFLVRGLN